MAARAHRYDAARSALQQRRREQAGHQEMAEVVRAELQLEPVRGLRERARHDARIVDEDVKSAVSRKEAIGKATDVLQRPELELFDLDVLVTGRAADAGGDRLPFGDIAGGEDHVGA